MTLSTTPSTDCKNDWSSNCERSTKHVDGSDRHFSTKPGTQPARRPAGYCLESGGKRKGSSHEYVADLNGRCTRNEMVGLPHNGALAGPGGLRWGPGLPAQTRNGVESFSFPESAMRFARRDGSDAPQEVRRGAPPQAVALM
jgi:hypothetical protein